MELNCTGGFRILGFACVECPMGRYSDSVNATDCSECPTGRTTSFVRSTECNLGDGPAVWIVFVVIFVSLEIAHRIVAWTIHATRAGVHPADGASRPNLRYLTSDQFVRLFRWSYFFNTHPANFVFLVVSVIPVLTAIASFGSGEPLKATGCDDPGDAKACWTVGRCNGWLVYWSGFSVLRFAIDGRGRGLYSLCVLSLLYPLIALSMLIADGAAFSSIWQCDTAFLLTFSFIFQWYRTRAIDGRIASVTPDPAFAAYCNYVATNKCRDDHVLCIYLLQVKCAYATAAGTIDNDTAALIREHMLALDRVHVRAAYLPIPSIPAGEFKTVDVIRPLTNGKEVSLCQWITKPDNQRVVKCSFRDANRATAAAAAKRECDRLHECQNDGIVKLFGRVDDDAFIIEYHSCGDLQQFLRDPVRRREWNLTDRVRFAMDIVDALAALHGRGYFHRDLKSGNILVKDVAIASKHYYRAVLCDLGLAEDGVLLRSRYLSGENLAAGTLNWKAPEMLRIEEKVDTRTGTLPLPIRASVPPATDVWALGCVFVELFRDPDKPADVIPFNAYRGKEHEFRTAIADAAKQTRAIIPPEFEDLKPDVQSELKTLISQMFTVSPDHRPTLNQIRSVLDPLMFLKSMVLRGTLPPQPVLPPQPLLAINPADDRKLQVPVTNSNLPSSGATSAVNTPHPT